MFLTPDEVKKAQINLCVNCDNQYDCYREHIVFDILKEKADPFYMKMQERQRIEDFEKKLTNGSAKQIFTKSDKVTTLEHNKSAPMEFQKKVSMNSLREPIVCKGC